MRSEITSNTLISRPRLRRLRRYARIARRLEGDVVEVGVYKGGSAYLLGQHLREGSTLYVFDTFTGLPEVCEFDTHKTGDFNDATPAEVAALLKPFNAKIIEGLFPSETGWAVEGKQFSLVHLDCDIYSSVRDSLAFFESKMVKGGIIVLDDVYAPTCPGAAVAVAEFVQSSGRVIGKQCEDQGAIMFA